MSLDKSLTFVAKEVGPFNLTISCYYDCYSAAYLFKTASKVCVSKLDLN
jgi:hypothetical protein